MMKRLLSIGRDVKTVKGEAFGWKTAIMYMSPGTKEICPFASAGCRKACLNTAGHGAFNVVQKVRKARTLLYLQKPEEFSNMLKGELRSFWKHYAARYNLCARLNGTSDLEFKEIRKALKGYQIVFYDYTKSFMRCIVKKITEPSYDLTYSYKETDKPWKLWLARLLHIRTAVVFHKVPKTYHGIKVIKGDDSDLRFLEPKTVIVGLKAKGKARYDVSGFVK